MSGPARRRYAVTLKTNIATSFAYRSGPQSVYHITSRIGKAV
jgi:hypothetical protein